MLAHAAAFQRQGAAPVPHLWLVSSTVRPASISPRMTPHSSRRAPVQQVGRGRCCQCASLHAPQPHGPATTSTPPQAIIPTWVHSGGWFIQRQHPCAAHQRHRHRQLAAVAAAVGAAGAVCVLPQPQLLQEAGGLGVDQPLRQAPSAEGWGVRADGRRREAWDRQGSGAGMLKPCACRWVSQHHGMCSWGCSPPDEGPHLRRAYSRSTSRPVI